MDDKVIIHYGVLGMKWGRRRGGGPSVGTRVRRAKKAALNSKVGKNVRNKKAWLKLLKYGTRDAAVAGLLGATLSYALTGSKKNAAKSLLRSAAINATLNTAIGSYKIATTGNIKVRGEK